jgi:hypothetical protein
MNEPRRAHQAIDDSIDASRTVRAPPPPPKDHRSSAGLALLLCVIAGVGFWFARSEGEAPTVAPSREAVQEGAAQLDILPGADGSELVYVDERVQEDLSGLRAAEIAWLDRGNPPRSLPPCPSSDPTRGLHAWGGPCLQEWKAATAWQIPKMSPCRYQIFAAPPLDFRLVAECDADGDGQFETWVADRTTAPQPVRLSVQD